MTASTLNEDHLILIESIDHSHIRVVDERKKETVLDVSLEQYLDDICIRHGSTLEGRTVCFAKTLGIRQKPAVLLSEMTGQIFFPTESIRRNEHCALFSYQHILRVRREKSGKTVVLFINGYTYETDTDVRTIRRQMERCRHFLDILYHHEAA
ncbi:MAG: competence protein ComK [Solobacterium sp.]|nr:competence protein ComK [Solobacterium sp.]